MGGKTRVRRSAEDARRRILDAAEEQLRERGPDALRLTALAAEIGVSHPTILHHFGSKTALVEAVVERTIRRLEEQIHAALTSDFDPAAGASILEQVFTALGQSGSARMFAWLFLARGDAERDPVGYGGQLRSIAERIHELRCARHDVAVPFEDTLFTVLLASLAMFGNAIAGPAVRRSAGLDDDEGDGRRFTIWFADLLHEHLESAASVARQRQSEPPTD